MATALLSLPGSRISMDSWPRSSMFLLQLWIDGLLWHTLALGSTKTLATTQASILDFVFIMEGLSLFELLGKTCVLSCKLRARFLQTSRGPRDPSAYCIALAFWVAQADPFGPLITHVPDCERNTHASPSLQIFRKVK